MVPRIPSSVGVYEGSARSTFSSQNRMSISRYIVVAVARCSWTCSRLSVRRYSLPKPKAGEDGAHGERVLGGGDDAQAATTAGRGASIRSEFRAGPLDSSMMRHRPRK
jgi:hypothetical protein